MKKKMFFCKKDILGIISLCDGIRVWVKVDDIFQNIFASVQHMHFAMITFILLIQNNISFSHLNDAA